MQNIFTIIVTHNGSKTIRECLAHLRDSRHSTEVVIVENASSDDTLEIIHEFTNVLVLQQKHNLGFGQANNIGIRYALERNADYVFLVNQDVLIEPDTIDILIRVGEEEPGLGIISPMPLNADGSAIDHDFVDYITRGNRRFFSDALFNRLDEWYSMPFINAACWLIPVRCIHKIGGFDDLFFMYGEDDDYCNRALLHGFKIGLVPSTTVKHYRVINLGKKTYFQQIQTIAKRNSTIIINRLKSSHRKFLMEVMLWEIDYHAKFFTYLLKRHQKLFFALVLTGIMIIGKLPKIYTHKRISRAGPAFLFPSEK